MQQVRRLLVEGQSDCAITAAHSIIAETGFHYVASILAKCAVESRATAAVYPVRHGLAWRADSVTAGAFPTTPPLCGRPAPK